MSTPTIAAALSAVMADVGAVRKGDRNDHQKFMFRGIDAVMNAVSPALRKHGVVVTPDVQSCVYETVQTTQGKPSTACRVVVAYVFTGPAGDSLRAVVPGEAWDAGDKATPKAMSVAYRTALLQALCLPTDDPDPDHDTFERAPARPPVAPPDLVDLIANAPDLDTLRTLWASARDAGLLPAETGRGNGETVVALLKARGAQLDAAQTEAAGGAE